MVHMGGYWDVGRMTGATMADNPSTSRLRKRYCTLQFYKRTIEDQQDIILHEMIDQERGDITTKAM